MVKTTMGNCVWLSSLLGIPKIDAKSLFNQAVSQYTGRIGGWYENTYEFQDDDNFDNESFNNTVERRLDEILEIIQEPKQKGRVFYDVYYWESDGENGESGVLVIDELQLPVAREDLVIDTDKRTIQFDFNEIGYLVRPIQKEDYKFFNQEFLEGVQKNG
jgi:hypothetical protein